jgi:hypothetical protein
MRLRLFVLTFLICSFGFSQSKGTISGVLTDKEANNEPLPFANVSIKDKNINATTDMDGKYTINIAPGKYIIQFSFVGYEPTEEPVTVEANKTTIVNKVLSAGGYTLESVVIQGKVNREKESSLLIEQKNAVETKQSIGAEEMSRKGASNVAAAVVKTTGITKQEGSGDIFIRGLGDRYNQTTLNGLPLPANDPSKKNIKLDLFSSDIVQTIGVDKTFSYKNFGDFGGASIDIVSKEYTSTKGMLEIGSSMGINEQATTKEFQKQDGTPALGFSKVTYPRSSFSTYSFENNWNTNSTVAPLNSSLFIRGGKSFTVGEEGKLGFFATASFDNNYAYKSGVARGAVAANGTARKDFQRESFSYNTNTTLMGSVNYKINNNNSLKLSTLFINTSNQDHDEYTGTIDIFDVAADGGGYVRRSNYEQTSLLVNQLLGKHTLSEQLKLNWGVGYNTLNNIIPDRMQNTVIPLEGQPDLNIKEISDNNDSENHRFFQELTDDQISANLGLEYALNEKHKVNIGYAGYMKNVSFAARQFNFNINNDASVTQPTVDVHNLDAYFNQANLNAGLFEITTFNGGLAPQTFDGEQISQAGFGGIESKWSDKLTTLFGLRGEYIIQNIVWLTNLGRGSKNFDTVEILPSLNVKYELNDTQNLKLAASKTYTLPQIKERAEFQFENITEVYFGNKDLYQSTNYNLDIKWEWFPKNGEVISLTGFGKLIQNPINEVTIASATNDISFLNTGDQATVVGAEFELKKTLFEFNSENKENINFGLNVSYMYNNQDFNADKVVEETDLNVFFTYDNGKLTGASDLLFNTDVSYFKEFSKEKNILATIAYNYFSDRLYAIGTNGRGNLVDSAVGTLDLILKSDLNKNFSMGLSVRNLTNPTIERMQETQDVVVSSYTKGVDCNLSMVYKF